MCILALLPSRRDARSLPGKTLAFVTARPMVRWAWEASSGATGVNEVVVATDDERICRTVQEFDGQVVLTGLVLPSGSERGLA
jgi:3-deoxy-manno-octulosonate cytidylyltransferase (CMP-KDO synthetase)